MSSGSGAADRRAGLPSSGEVPAEHNAIAPGANASAVRLIDYVGNDFVFLLFWKPSFLLTLIPPFVFFSGGMALSSIEAPADRNASATDGADTSKKVRHILQTLQMISNYYYSANLAPFWIAQIHAQAICQPKGENIAGLSPMENPKGSLAIRPKQKSVAANYRQKVS